MPTQSPPQPSVPESSAKPDRPSADAAAPKPAPEGTLFHLLVESGWDAALAYTADQRIHAMTSEIVATALEPVMAELRQIRETMAGSASKEDLANFATKEDLANFVTREDLKATLANYATKADLRRELAELETRLVKWVFGAMLAQTAVIVGLVTLLK